MVKSYKSNTFIVTFIQKVYFFQSLFFFWNVPQIAQICLYVLFLFFWRHKFIKFLLNYDLCLTPVVMWPFVCWTITFVKRVDCFKHLYLTTLCLASVELWPLSSLWMMTFVKFLFNTDICLMSTEQSLITYVDKLTFNSDLCRHSVPLCIFCWTMTFV